MQRTSKDRRAAAARSLAARALVLAILLTGVARAWGQPATPNDDTQDWPAWRGSQGSGDSPQTNVPLRWSGDQNVRWKVALPGPGNSTPIVWREQVFVTCASEEGKRRALLCLDANDGKQIWERSVEFDQPEVSHETNPQCSSSPVTDGKRVIAWHGSAGVHAYDLQGQPLWQVDLGTFEHVWGTGSSPLLYDDLVILNCGPGIRAFVVALDARTGKEVWRRTPPGIESEKVSEFHGSWSTPVIMREGDQDIVLLSLPGRLWALSPRTGEEVWNAAGLGKLVYTSPLVMDELVVAMSGYHGPAMAVRRGGQGDISETHRLWYHEAGRDKVPQRVGSGVVVGDHIFILNEPGIAWCLNSKTGERLWEHRLEQGRSWSSMCHVDGRLYALTMKGDTYVLAADPSECQVLAKNSIGEMTRASLAFSAGRVYQRTYQHLYCFEDQATKASQ